HGARAHGRLGRAQPRRAEPRSVRGPGLRGRPRLLGHGRPRRPRAPGERRGGGPRRRAGRRRGRPRALRGDRGRMTALEARLEAAGLRPPRYDSAHLGLVLPALADALGAGAGPQDAAARARLGLGTAERAVVVLVDGLGRGNLAELAGHSPFLRSLLASGGELVTGFPTTTASALGLFGTGQPPGRT